MTAASAIRALRGQYPGRFSTDLGIDLSQGRSREIFKWFLASVLFGARISESIVKKTFREFASRAIVSPKVILDTGWDGLVEVLDQGGYVRYDFKTATKLLDLCRAWRRTTRLISRTSTLLQRMVKTSKSGSSHLPKASAT